MKTRLLIASIFTFAVALVIAVTLRTTASAQQEVGQAPGAESDADPGIEPAISSAVGEPPEEEVEESRLVGESNVEEESDLEGEISVWDEEDGVPPPGREPVSDAEEGTAEPAGELTTEEEAEAAVADETEPLPEEEESVTSFNFDVEVDDGIARDEEDNTITVDFPDEEIRTILRQVADVFELNLVVPELLTGRASISLRNVTWQQVFDVVLSPVGFTYVEDQNIIKVVSLESLTMEPAVTTVVILDYAQAEGILPSIEPLISAGAGGRIQVDNRSNALIITERPNQLRRIEEIIAELDRPNIQVMIESKFVETRNRHMENIGVNWASLDGYEVRAGPFDHQYSRERGNADQQGRDIQSGTQSQQNQTMTNGVAGSTSTAQASSSNNIFDSSLDTDTTTRLSTAVFSADQFNVILSALRTTDDVKLVSNPTVVTLNNRPARIHIGEEFPVVLPRFNPQTGSYEAGEYTTIDIGIKLDVTPQVNNAGFVNLEVEPQVSSLSSTVSYFGAEYPIVATRNAKTEVTIKDGFTVAIGGLVQDDTLNVERRVPVLGSIPGIGRLFRSDSKDNDQRNLIIFLTARTLSPDGSGVEDTIDPRMIHRMGLKREEIPGYRPDIEMWPDSPPAPRSDAPAASDPEVNSDAGLRADPEADVAVDEEAAFSEGTEMNDVGGDAEPDGEAIEGETPEAIAEGEESTAEILEDSETVSPTAETGAQEETEAVVPEEEETAPVIETEPEAAPETESRRGGWLTP